MVKKQQMTSLPKTSSLERFELGFEFNQTLQEIKHDLRRRTI
ncbi:MAG: hypothetical protein V4611_04275 [Patescibacteria group bacterium]